MRRVIRQIGLTDFRNYAALSLSLTGSHVVITGENGAGKTNLLEAVSFLAPGRGMRRAVLSDVAREGSLHGFAVSSEVETDDAPVQIGTGTFGGIARR